MAVIERKNPAAITSNPAHFIRFPSVSFFSKNHFVWCVVQRTALCQSSNGFADPAKDETASL
jgi:hypothetical protein